VLVRLLHGPRSRALCLFTAHAVRVGREWTLINSTLQAITDAGVFICFSGRLHLSHGRLGYYLLTVVLLGSVASQPVTG